MKIKKYLASFIAVLMMGMVVTACNKPDENETETLSDSSDST